MLTFTSPQFIPVIILFIVCWHFLLPNILKKPALLAFSYYYAWQLGGVRSLAAIAVITVLTFVCALVLSKTEKKKPLVFFYVIIITLLLVYTKQSVFLMDLLQKITHSDKFTWNVVSLVGLSYYGLAGISYIVDISRGKDEADKNFLDVALWTAFFTKLIAGPIDRHKDFKVRLNELPVTKFDIENVKRGMLICARGYFYKLIIADRLSIFVNAVFQNASDNFGFTLITALILSTLEIYFDFAGYSYIAYGISYALDLRIANNFRHPFFSASIQEFWTRWHISLSSWLKDYIYIPLGGSRKGKLRKELNNIIVFLVSGLWHGNGIMFILWGLVQAMLQLFDKLIQKRSKIFPKIVNILITFLLISTTMVFFRSESLQAVKIFIKRIFTKWNPEIFIDGTLTSFGIDLKDWCVLLTAMLIVLVIEIFQYNGVSIYAKLQKNNIVIRWAVYYLILIILLVFGMYGTAYDVNNFIYFRF